MNELFFEKNPHIVEVIALLEAEGQKKITQQYDLKGNLYEFSVVSKWSNKEKAQRFINNVLEILLAFGLGKFRNQMDETLKQVFEENLADITTDKSEMLFDLELNPDALAFDFLKCSNFVSGDFRQFLQILHSVSQSIPRRYTSPALSKLKKHFYNFFEKEKFLQQINASQTTFDELYKALS